MRSLSSFLPVIIIIILILFTGSNLTAQEPEIITPAEQPKSLIVKNDGTEYVGIIITQDEREILLETETIGRLYIPKHEIRSITELTDADFRGGEYLGENLFATRYFITTNGLQMKKGDKYALINWYGPEFHAAVEDNFSMGVMTSWVAIPIIGSAKYSFQIAENTNGAIGLLAGTGSWAAIDGLAGLLYGSLTFGNSRNNLTLSAGYGGFSYEGEGSGSALFSIAGAARLSDKVALVGDSFIFDADGSLAAIIIPGLRFYRTNKGAFQFGFAGMVVEGETFPVPFPFISWFIKI